jgi:hypothetical protein
MPDVIALTLSLSSMIRCLLVLTFAWILQGGLRKMNLDKGVRYDPYVGFTIRANRDFPGHYVCKVDKEKPVVSVPDSSDDNDQNPKETSSSRSKRDVSLVIPPTPEEYPPQETATSPGIPAFPSSSELLELTQTQAEVSLSEVPPAPPHSYPPMKRRRKNRPEFMRRGGPPHIQGTDPHPAMFHRRGGPPPPPGHRLPHPPRHRRPFFRLRPPMHLMGPVPRPHPHHSQPPHFHFQPTTAVGLFVGNGSSTLSGQDAEYSALPLLPQNDYLYPSPVLVDFPPPPRPINVLPTFIQKGSKLRPPYLLSLSEEKLQSSSEALRRPVSLSSGELLSSRVDNRTQSNIKNSRTKPPKRVASAILSQNLLPQTMNIMNSMSCVLKKVILGPDAPCNGSLLEDVATASIRRRPPPHRPDQAGTDGGGGNGFSDIPPHGSGSNRGGNLLTILEVDILPSPENKFYPKDSVLYTAVPFFVKWQTRFTDYADHVEVNHTLRQGSFKRHKAGVFEDGVNSFEVFNLSEGESGKITVSYMGRNKEILTHSWKFFVVSKFQDLQSYTIIVDYFV